MSQTSPPASRSIAVTLVGAITLLYGLACMTVSVLIYVKGNEAVDELFRWLSRLGIEAKVSASGESWYRTMVLICASCVMLWGLPIAFAGFRVLTRQGRVLAIIFGILAALGGSKGLHSALGPDNESAALVPALIWLAYGLFTTITLFVRAEEFERRPA